MPSYTAEEDLQDNQPPLSDVSEDDEALLQEIRDSYSYLFDQWVDLRQERNLDVKYVSGDPWEADDRRARKDAGRPCISHDELNQYINHCVNNVRQNKRGIKVEPDGGTSTEKSATDRQNLIRGIEYRSQAPDIYCNAFQQMVEGSYSFFRVGREYVSNDTDSDDPSIFNQRITIGGIPNPNSVLFDLDCKKPDWSDARKCFVLDPMPKDEFKRRYPWAQITDFSAEHMRTAKDWIQDKIILVAEYWRIRIETRRKYLLMDGRVVNQLARGQKYKQKRQVEKKTVWQYLTNGVEILDRIEQPGTILGIIPMIGLERYLDDNGVSKRKLFSLTRLARDPQMSLAYLESQEMEEAGLTPKTPFIGYVGQFETDKAAWDEVTKIPHAYLQADVMVDGAAGTVLPLPTRVPFTPNFQAYEVAKDSCRRAVQAAMGISPLPTAAQRDNQKSGVAIERMDQQQEVGSYHLVAGYGRAVALCGRVVDEWTASTYDTERVETMRKPDDSAVLARLNTPEPYADEKTGAMVHYPISADDTHGVTVSDGPSASSQFEAAGEFLDLLIQNLQTLPIPPPAQAKILAMAIQMKQLGPKGDEMAEIISPTDAGQAGQAQQQIAAMQMQTQQQGELLQAMQAELQKLQLEKAGKVIDNQYKIAIEKMREENALAIAEVNTKAQSLSERMEFVTDLAHKFLDQAHDVGTQAQEHANASAQASQDQAHQVGMQAQQSADAAAAQQPPAEQD